MLRIATRRSPLARWQADHVADQLRALGHEVELVLLSSEGDIDRTPIDGSQAVGLFTKRIQQAVIDGEADLAVHSLKDLPTQESRGLMLAAVPPRASAADCLITREPWSFDELPERARVGTGSRRRAAQLLARRPDLRIEPIRGNVDTRLEKLSSEGFDAIILAEAGLRRLQLLEHVNQPLPLEWMLPAAGQGALGIEVRDADAATAEAVAELDDAPTHVAVAAERAVLRELHAGCLAPVGTYATVRDGQLTLRAVVLSVDGQQRLHCLDATEPAETLDRAAAERLGREVARRLVEDGAAPLVEAAR
ncbi:hydroxymethylbilane synthase [Candidatus Laterigemmans baculatus]|uniref:hydroxymethylbilane synthase n=1 Tax=Candidatus Laterigemmans baculatus TaxID=2770505 RepID=UPI0013DCA15E|nr:hydroxymethylbilane synthase [Candidatus Laterigemmans baculatus]